MMGLKKLLDRAREAAVLDADESRMEETTAWCNHDLVPLPPSRRVWGWFNFFGAAALGALNVSAWQVPNTLLTQGLSVSQAMIVIVVSRWIIAAWSCLTAWCGLRWHVGFTVQSRFTWGMRGAYIPLVQRALLNFIWCAIQCWNGGKLVSVCITSIWPSFSQIPNTLTPDTPTTTYELVGFIVFWLISVPFLFIRPERYKKPFFLSCVACAIAMVVMVVWALAVARGVGPIFYQGESTENLNRFGLSWTMMATLNQAIGGYAAGMTNESDFGRYGKNKRSFVIGTFSVQWVTGILVSLAGLVTTSACQLIYNDIYWNPPDLMMVMMEHGNGSPGARVGVFFLALAFTFCILFQNVSVNAFAGGIDLAGIFPRYVDIRRGAFITFLAVWVFQPWQLINRAATFVSVLSSFSVFLAPLMGVMVCDYFVIRRQRIRLNHLYRPKGSDYWFTAGFNMRVIPCWIAGWAPTIGGLILSVGGMKGPDALYELYYVAFFVGFCISFVLFWGVNLVWPPPGAGEFDPFDDWATFTPAEAARLGIVPHDNAEEMVETRFGESGYGKHSVRIVEEKMRDQK